jgi:hypothetical protein
LTRVPCSNGHVRQHHTRNGLVAFKVHTLITCCALGKSSQLRLAHSVAMRISAARPLLEYQASSQ